MTRIGRVWLGLGVLGLLRSLFDLAAWQVLRPSMPVVANLLGIRPLQARLFPQLFAHLTKVKIAEAILSVAVGVAAYHFLRLAPWSRVALQAICWSALAYVVSFALLWAAIWTKISAGTLVDPSLSDPSNARFVLFAGVAVCTALATGLAVMIASLRSAQIRDAFESARG